MRFVYHTHQPGEHNAIEVVNRDGSTAAELDGYLIDTQAEFPIAYVASRTIGNRIAAALNAAATAMEGTPDDPLKTPLDANELRGPADANRPHRLY
jgi:hypothetical protein